MFLFCSTELFVNPLKTEFSPKTQSHEYLALHFCVAGFIDFGQDKARIVITFLLFGFGFLLVVETEGTVGSLHGHCLAEVLEVHPVFPFFGLGHDGSKAVPPEHLLGDVGRPHLAGGTGGLHGAIQKHHQLKVLLQEGFCCHVEEGAVLVYDVVNGEGRDEEKILVASVHHEFDVDLVQDDGLPLGGDGGFQQLPVDVAAYQQALPQVGHTDQEAQLPPTLADHSVLAERDGLGPVFGPGDLGQDGPTHEGIDDDPQDGLEDEQEDGSGTLLCDTPEAIADGHLGLQGEEEG